MDGKKEVEPFNAKALIKVLNGQDDMTRHISDDLNIIVNSTLKTLLEQNN